MIKKVPRSKRYSDLGDKQENGYYDELRNHRKEKRKLNAIRSRNVSVLLDLEEED